MNQKKSAILILAGATGSGKSTLLRRAYHHGIPAFGEESMDLFLQTNPARGPEQHLFEDAAPTKLFQAKHVPNLLAAADRPEVFLVHIDLLNLLMVLILDPAIQQLLPPHLRQTLPRTPDDLLDRAKNREIFLHYLKNAFACADSLVVNTLYPPFHRNAEQWNQRAEFLRQTAPHVDTETLRFVFDPHYPRRDIHTAVYESWFAALRESQCERAYVSKAARGMLEITEIIPDSGVTKTYPFPAVNKAPSPEN